MLLLHSTTEICEIYFMKRSYEENMMEALLLKKAYSLKLSSILVKDQKQAEKSC